MVQTMTTLSFRSRMTSSSYSFHPRSDDSTRTSRRGLSASPRVMNSSNSAGVRAMFPPVPPSVNDGRMIAGNPIRPRTASASPRLRTIALSGTSRPISAIVRLKASRSSARWIASRDAPISSTPNFSSTPRSARDMAMLRAVWPPIVGRRASGRSRSMIRSTVSGVIGSMYVRSAVSGSVMIVAGLLLIRTIRYPSSRRALQACVPE